MKKTFVALLMFIGLISIASAHQPRMVESSSIEVNDPTTSQAFYAELQGEKQTYTIHVESDSRMYIELTVPDISGARTDFNATLEQSGNIVSILSGQTYGWTGFFEEYARDSYLSWPSFSWNLSAWIYTITVSNTDNRGKYVLVVGYKEDFPLHEIWHAMITVPHLKVAYFDKWRLSWVPTIVWASRGIALVIVIAIVLLVRYIRKKKSHRNTKKTSS